MKYSKGFTLLEILLVTAVISILALIIIIAINPNRQLAQVRNSARYSDLSAISDALSQYFIDNGEYPTGLSETYQEICVQDASDCTGYLDIRNALVPTYIASIPQDPETLSSGTGYEVMIHPVNQKISVQAIYAELGASILINPVPLWTPAQVSTQLWLDQSDISTITFASLDNAQVSQWNDKSGNNRHAIQGVSDSQPILSQGGVSFDGTDDFLNVDLDFLSGTDHQAYIVADNISNHSNFYGATTGGSGSESLHVGFRNDSSFRINYWGNDFLSSYWE